MPPSRRAPRTPRAALDAPLDTQIDEAAAQAETAARSEDIAAGLVPVWARRSLHPWELAARVSFAAIDVAEQATGAAIARRLADDRARFTHLLAVDLARLATGAEIVDRLVALEVGGIGQIEGVPALLNASAADLGATLRQHAVDAGNRAAGEAAAQGVTAAPFVLDAAQALQIDQLANRLAVAPHVDLLRALRDEATRLPTPAEPGPLLGELGAQAGQLAVSPLEQAARTATAQADGMGRQAAADAIGEPVQIYASELLDGNTCPPCSLIDGTAYPDMVAARRDYPAGIYVNCEGRERCRGTLVFVWPTESPATT